MYALQQYRVPNSQLLSVLVIVLLVTTLPRSALATPDTPIRLVSLPIITDKEDVIRHTARFDFGGPIKSSSCGYARVSHVGVSVNKGAKAVLHYKIRVKAVTAEKLAYADSAFFKELPKVHRQSYKALKNQYSGGLDIPFLKFLGVDLDDSSGKGKRAESLSDDDFFKLSNVAERILKKVVSTDIVIKGKLKATGISCMKTTAFAFVKVAKVQLRGGSKLTVLTAKESDSIAATKHADTLLPSEGKFKVIDF